MRFFDYSDNKESEVIKVEFSNLQGYNYGRHQGETTKIENKIVARKNLNFVEGIVMDTSKKSSSKSFWLVASLIAFAYIGFFTYFCVAKPNKPNNVVLEKMITIEESNAKTINDQTTKSNQSSEEITNKGVDTKTSIGPETYLCQITEFYQQIITILFGVIGVLLVVSFIYVHSISRSKADELAREALKEESFKIKLEKMVEDLFIKSKNEGDIAELCQEQELINERVTFLENALNKQSDESGGSTGIKENGNT
jgi:hypothetical protein